MGQDLNLNGGGVTDDSDYTSVFHTHTFLTKRSYMNLFGLTPPFQFKCKTLQMTFKLGKWPAG